MQLRLFRSLYCFLFYILIELIKERLIFNFNIYKILGCCFSCKEDMQNGVKTFVLMCRIFNFVAKLLPLVSIDYQTLYYPQFRVLNFLLTKMRYQYLFGRGKCSWPQYGTYEGIYIQCTKIAIFFKVLKVYFLEIKN